MRIFQSFGFVLFALLTCVSTNASADLLIKSTHWQHSVPGVVVTNHQAGLMRVGYSKRAPENVDSHVIVVRRHATYWIKSAYGQGRVRITVPVEFYLSSWDVKALERELERLGIKVRPKPVPRPKPVVSG